jgi:hypothetical protein
MIVATMSTTSPPTSTTPPRLADDPHELEHGGCANIDATKRPILRKDSAMGDKSPKNTSKTKKQKAQKKAASAPKPSPKK